MLATILDEEGDGVGSGAVVAAVPVEGKRRHEPAICTPLDESTETVQNPLNSSKTPSFCLGRRAIRATDMNKQ